MTRHFDSTLRSLAPATLALAAAVALAVPAAALATPTPYVVTLTQQGANVVAVGGGSIDLAGLSLFTSTNSTNAAIDPVEATLSLGTGPDSIYAANSMQAPSSFGVGEETNTNTTSGETTGPAGEGEPWMFVPQGYVSDTALSNGATWADATFASLGVTPGIYAWTWGSGADQSFTLDIALPEPAEWGMFGLGLLLIGGFVTLRRRSS